MLTVLLSLIDNDLIALNFTGLQIYCQKRSAFVMPNHGWMCNRLTANNLNLKFITSSSSWLLNKSHVVWKYCNLMYFLVWKTSIFKRCCWWRKYHLQHDDRKKAATCWISRVVGNPYLTVLYVRKCNIYNTVNIFK